ncbi:MAG: response regulator transcription factor [Rhizomicrobium sp.]
MARLLVVEDNEELAGLLVEGLGRQGFVVDRVAMMADARNVLSQNQYAVAILDLGLPDGDATVLLRSLRANNDPTPILVLTARGSVRDRVDGLSAGADDYLAKPFAFEELVARIQALLRRPSEFLGKPLRVGNVTFDTAARQVFVDENPQVLSAREVAVLELLIKRSGRVVLKGAVEDHLYGLSGEVRSNAVEVYVHRLRKHLVDAGATANIHTIRGLGYLIRETEP